MVAQAGKHSTKPKEQLLPLVPEILATNEQEVEILAPPSHTPARLQSLILIPRPSQGLSLAQAHHQLISLVLI